MNIVATAYRSLHQYKEAAEYGQIALNIALRSTDTAKKLVALKGLIRTYSEAGEYDSAISLTLKAISIAKMIHSEDLVYFTNNAGFLYSEKKDTSNAIMLFQSAIDIYKSQNTKIYLPGAFLNIADIYRDMHEYDTALHYYFDAISLVDTGLVEYYSYVYKHYNAEIAKTYLAIAKDNNTKMNRGKGIFNSPMANLHQAIVHFAPMFNDGNPDLLYYPAFIETQKMLGNYTAVAQLYEQYVALLKTEASEAGKTQLANLEVSRSVSEKEKQVIQEKQKEIKIRNERLTLIYCIVFLFCVTGLTYRNARQQNISNKLIKKEKQRSDDLLLNILPTEVAEELKNKGSASAKYFEDVTVLFTDFVGFTKVSERLSPQDLVNELDVCFKAFDEIIGRYKIEKIKTIGDAYLAVAGLPTPDKRHAENAINAAIEIRNFIINRQNTMGDLTFNIRIGIHSGSVVAGIVGIKKFAYDIWGDTVNTAARMEQNSEAGKINISQNTYELIGIKFDCEYRGEIDAKNKGKLKMYFVK